MTITTTSTKAVYQGNGATTTWPFTFLIPDDDSIVVTLVLISSGDETVLAPSVFSVSGLGVPAGGTVTYPLSGSPLAATYKIVVERFVPELQNTDLVNEGGAYPADIEDALDYLTMMAQQLQDQIDRAIVFSVADTGSDGSLPIASARANKFLSFDSAGDPAVVDGLTAGTTVSAAMIPVVTAPTTTDALIALGLPGSFLDLLIPAGTMWDYTLTTAPTGFVFPFGQACTSTYPVYRAALVAAGSPYGTNGTDPLMPDMRSRVAAGKSNMGGVSNGLLTGGTVLGTLAAGTQTKVLIAANLPPHAHTGTTDNEGTTHTHSSPTVGLGPAGGAEGFGAGGLVNIGVTTGVESAFHTHTFTSGNGPGTSTALNVVQPTLICNKILKVH